jgi:hypothetical protein
MPIDQSILASHVAHAIAEYPGQMLFKGQTIACSVSPITDRDDVDAMGILEECDCELVCLLSSLAGLGYPQKRIDVIQARHTNSSEWQSFHVEAREIDSITVRLTLRRL